MKLETLLQSVETLAVSGAIDVDVGGIDYDSRRVEPGHLFVAVRGHQDDGGNYVSDALSGGATVIVSENDPNLGAGVTHVKVTCARRAMAELASAFYGHPSDRMKVIGITGTNGKTTTAYMIRNLLRGGGFSPGLLGTVAYEIGDRTIPAARTTPEAPDLHALFRRMLDAGCDSAVMEVSSHAIALQRVHGIDYDVCVFTNLSRDHLDYHGDMESYYHVKSRLFRACKAGKQPLGVINVDDPWGRRLVAESDGGADLLTYGFSEAAAVRAADVEINVEQTRFTAMTPWGVERVSLRLLGRFNVSNALAALSVAGLCGVGPDRAADALSAICSVPGRLEPVPNRKNRMVFVDYAHTEDALRNVLATLRELCRGKLIVVFGCGGNRDRGKRSAMGRAAAELADFSILTSDNPRREDPEAIVRAIVEGFGPSDAFEVVLDRRAAIEQGIRKTGRKDILLIAGKGHETYQELAGTVVPFDDRETVREIMG